MNFFNSFQNNPESRYRNNSYVSANDSFRSGDHNSSFVAMDGGIGSTDAFYVIRNAMHKQVDIFLENLTTVVDQTSKRKHPEVYKLAYLLNLVN